MAGLNELDPLHFDADNSSYISDTDSDLDGPQSDNASVFSAHLSTGSTSGDGDDGSTDADTDGSYFSEGDDDGSFIEDSDRESYISADLYGEEPFDVFETRVLAFARSVMWPGAPVEIIAIERLQSKGAPRMARLTNRATQEQRILRVPWKYGEPLEYTIAATRLVQEHTQISTPDLVMFDLTDDNPLNSPYFVHMPTSGSRVYRVYDNLDHQRRCQVARQVGDIYRQTLAMQSSVLGQPVLAPNERDILVVPSSSMHLIADIDHTLQIGPPARPAASAAAGLYPAYTPSRDGGGGGDGARPGAVLELLTSIFDRWIAADLELDLDHGRWRIDHTKRFLTMASELSALGYLNDSIPICFHPNLWEFNILIDQEEEDEQHPSSPPSHTSTSAGSDPQTTIRTTVRDWDYVDIVPAFVACKPPTWLWMWDTDDDVVDEKLLWIWEAIEHGRNSTRPAAPGTEREREIQEIFNEAAGPVYRRFAYDPVYVFARRLWRFAMYGMMLEHDEEEGNNMAEVWEELKREHEGRRPEVAA
ncbi:hypothetical protein C8A00DRAFT_32221 [Chaetomidium leptoderma]|uniref:Aminoglycoside phosphotransferase domain-containing protein n=1 Tax=Chaetomidium leptoderma TaxID=669021 RepID=A0AAN6VNP1_9PEZI|nr:hypothetical protein C8A00DRAFT_32221 [Chaetomidium leptoderma]